MKVKEVTTADGLVDEYAREAALNEGLSEDLRERFLQDLADIGSTPTDYAAAIRQSRDPVAKRELMNKLVVAVKKDPSVINVGLAAEALSLNGRHGRVEELIDAMIEAHPIRGTFAAPMIRLIARVNKP